MVWPIIGIVITFAPTVYYGLTQGEWLYGWDYVLTGKDYVGEFVDGIFPEEDYAGDEWESGLTDGDYDFLTDAFGSIQELITVGIVFILIAIAVFALLRGRD